MITEAMLKNVYRAFDYQQDEQVYDALARSASGTFLENCVPSNQKRSDCSRAGRCAFSCAGGAMGVLLHLCPQLHRKLFLNLIFDGRVTGTVEHWGHIHTREHAYDALIQIVAEGGQWKIGGMDVTSEEQLKSSTGFAQCCLIHFSFVRFNSMG